MSPLPASASQTSYSFISSLFNTLSDILNHHRGNQPDKSRARVTLRRSIDTPLGDEPYGETADDRAALTLEEQTEASSREKHGTNLAKAKNAAKPNELPQEARAVLLTLHVLFPHVLLDALDLLDRGCVIRLAIADTEHVENSGADNAASAPEQHRSRKRKRGAPLHQAPNAAYHVLSARSHSTHTASTTRARQTRDTTAAYTSHALAGASSSDASRPSHQVHLRAWNCSCPAFAFAAFSGLSRTSTQTASCALLISDNAPSRSDRDSHLTFGGLSVRRGGQVEEPAETAPPVCKHLLACLLGELCPGFFGPFGDVDGQDDVEQRGGRKGLREIAVGLVEAAGAAGGGVGGEEWFNRGVDVR